MIDADLAKHLLIQEHIRLPSTEMGQLTKHDILGHTTTIVQLTRSSSIHQNFDRFLEGSTHEGTGVGSVDSVSCDCHQMASRSHDIGEKGHVTIIDFGTIELDDRSQFLQEGPTRCFDTEYLQDFDE
jgi:hypothetical protein